MGRNKKYSKTITINSKKCTGCGICTAVCPNGRGIILTPLTPDKQDVKIAVITDNCDNCGLCSKWCGHNAIIYTIVPFDSLPSSSSDC